MKDKIKGAVIKEFLGLKSNMYLFLVDDSIEHKKAKGMNKNAVAKISDTEYKHVCWIKNVWGIWWIEPKLKIIK